MDGAPRACRSSVPESRTRRASPTSKASLNEAFASTSV
jgi:hypothetical protein